MKSFLRSFGARGKAPHRVPLPASGARGKRASYSARQSDPNSQAPSEAVTDPASLATWSVFLGGGLAILGLLAGFLAILDPLAARDPSQAALAARWLRAAWLVLAFGLAGSAAFYVLRLSSTLLGELLERDSRRSRRLEDGLDRAVRLLERIAEGIEQRTESTGFEPPVDSGRAGAANESHDRMAELKAAREVNDPERVLELYGMIAPTLEAEPRGSLQSEVAQWFLTLIYRRLRAGKIQVDVVELAGRFAETFAATIEGASVQAALPTLRRSAGLCPRCAQPYIGMGKACPECLRPGTAAAAPLLPSIDVAPPE